MEHVIVSYNGIEKIFVLGCTNKELIATNQTDDTDDMEKLENLQIEIREFFKIDCKDTIKMSIIITHQTVNYRFVINEYDDIFDKDMIIIELV